MDRTYCINCRKNQDEGRIAENWLKSYNYSNNFARRLMKKIIFLSLLVVSLCWGFYLHQHKNHTLPSVAQQTMAAAVDVVPVKVGALPREVHAIGTLVAAKQMQIIPEVNGQVLHIFFQDGVFVKEGTPLIQLDDAVNKAKLASVKANLAYSQADYQRKVILKQRGAISGQAVDQAKAELQEKKAAAEEAAIMVNKMRLVAPFDGVLGKANINVGDYVTAGQNLVSLTDVKHLRAEYVVSEKYYSQLKLGQRITITTTAYPNQEFGGTLTYISPTINTADRTIGLYADLANENQLLTAGLFVNVTHRLGLQTGILMVPAASLVPTIDGQHVFKIVDNKAISVPVKVGHWVKDAVEIVSGLDKQDQIVVAGQQKLKTGMMVRQHKA